MANRVKKEETKRGKPFKSRRFTSEEWNSMLEEYEQTGGQFNLTSSSKKHFKESVRRIEHISEALNHENGDREDRVPADM